MTATHPNSELPAGLTEADLIDLVDGVLSREREGIVLSALKKHPEMGLLAKQFRADRAIVAALGEVHAPSGMAEGVEARLEAAALRDLASQSREVPQPIRISQVQVREPSVLRLLMESQWTRRLATAASLAIVVGLGALGVRAVINALPSKPIAHKDRTPNPDPEITPAPTPDTEIATKPSDATPDVTPIDIAAAPTPMVEELTTAVAARLAAEGRLAITVRAAIAGPSLKRLESLARARDTGWHTVALDSPAQYAALMTPLVDPAPVTPSPTTPNPTTIAGTQSTQPSVIPPPPASSLPHLRPVVRAIYTVDLSPGEQPFESLVRSITDTLPEGATVTFRSLSQPIATPIALDPDSVLWWTSPVGRWSKRARVPIVVEGLE